MLRTFNCGVGLIVVADSARWMDVIAAFTEAGERAFAIGALAPSEGGESTVRYRGTLQGA